MRAVLTISLLLVAGMLLGCAATSSASQEAVETNKVEMPPSYLFQPSTIKVTAGATVTWHNSDNFTHDVHLMGPINWHSDPLKPGDSTTYTFTQPGVYPYLCDFHPNDMKGTVTVVSSQSIAWGHTP